MIKEHLKFLRYDSSTKKSKSKGIIDFDKESFETDLIDKMELLIFIRLVLISIC